MGSVLLLQNKAPHSSGVSDCIHILYIVWKWHIWGFGDGVFFYLFIDSHEGDTFSFVLIDFSFPSSLSTDMTKVEECKGTLLVR